MSNHISWNKEIEAQIVAKAWKDPKFKSLLLKNPAEALKEFGINWPKGISFNIQEETATQFYFILPSLPKGAEKCSTEELEKKAAACLLEHHT